MHLLVDDVRSLEADIIARNFLAATTILANLNIEELSIDHDLGVDLSPIRGYGLSKEFENSGYGLILWLLSYEETSLYVSVLPKTISIISKNPVGVQRIRDALINSKKYSLLEWSSTVLVHSE
jgi:hypothetical protein